MYGTHVPDDPKTCYVFEIYADDDAYNAHISSEHFKAFGVMGWEIVIKAKGWHGSAKIRYCPMCGRKLMREGGQDEK